MSSEQPLPAERGSRTYSEQGGLLERVEEYRRRRPPRRVRITQAPWWRAAKVTLTWTGLTLICILLVGAGLIAAGGNLPHPAAQATPAPTPIPCIAAPQPGQPLPPCRY